jgi:hypothetical protein
MYVMGKTAEGIIIAEELFRVLPSTVILDAEGREITLPELKVPSSAVVEYFMKTDNSAPTIMKLQVLREPKGSPTRRKIGGRGKHVRRYTIE